MSDCHCTPWTAACQASLFFTISQSLLKLMFFESLMPSNHLSICHPLLLPSLFPSIRVFSNNSVLCTRWPKYQSFSFSISLSNEYSGLTSLELIGLISLQSKGLSGFFAKWQLRSINPLELSSVLYGPTLTSIHDWKNHCFDYMDLYWQSNVSTF